MARTKMTAREKQQSKWVRETLTFLARRKVGGPKKWCHKRNEKARVGGRITKVSACTVYRKGLRTRRNKKRQGPQGRSLFTDAEWKAMTKEIHKAWKEKRRHLATGPGKKALVKPRTEAQIAKAIEEANYRDPGKLFDDLDQELQTYSKTLKPKPQKKIPPYITPKDKRKHGLASMKRA